VPVPHFIETEGVTLSLCGCGAGGGSGESVFALAGLPPPSEESFNQFFRGWFEQEHFPQFSQEIQRELSRRARSRGVIQGLASTVKGWAMANTDEQLQADVWCSYFLQNAPPQCRTFGCLRIASVNLGSQVVPCWASFWGVPGQHGVDHWATPPWTSLHVDASALMDELDGRGGMAALFAASA
jgi:hypothetical protein